MMNRFFLLFCVIFMVSSAIAQLNVDCLDDYDLHSNLYRTNNDSVEVSNDISSDAIYDNETENYYSAGDSIVLVAGFEVIVGTSFQAEINSCTGEPCVINGMHAALDEFDKTNYTISYSGTNVVFTTNGLPNHTSPYWSTTNDLYIDPYVTTLGQMAPGNIDNFNGSYSLTVPQSPAIANNSSSTGLGAIGLAVSGSVIYNDEEGPNVPLDNAIGSLDFNGAHTGPQSYHYHLEPHSWSHDDQQLIGVISDGFFLYGRKCNSTGTYPTDLDANNGHTSMTQHSCSAEYHYHIENVPYLGFYILFPYDYSGTPNNIN